MFNFLRKWVGEFWDDDFKKDAGLQASLQEFSASLPASMAKSMQKETQKAEQPGSLVPDHSAGALVLDRPRCAPEAIALQRADPN